MSTFAMPRRAMRASALVLAASIVAGCAGGSKGLLPSSTIAGPAAGSTSAWYARGAAHRHIKVRVRIRIPRRHGRAHELHPASISSLTQSVSITVDGGAAQTFNTTPASPGCSTGASGIVCTFAIDATVGTDTFVITTWSQTGGTGTPLDRGTAQIPITAGQANAIALTLGPVVSITGDSGVGSLRYAVATANEGDTIVFTLGPGSIIALATPIAIAGTVNIAGPGVASGNITVSGEGVHTIFNVTGSATISGLVLTEGQAPSAGSPGGAIANTGSLTLANDTIENSTSLASVRRASSANDFSRKLRLGHLHPHCVGAGLEGGAIYNDGSLVSSGNTYTGNTVSSSSCGIGQGGAIFNDALGSLASIGDTFTSNGAQYGGAVFTTSALPVTFTSDTFAHNFGCTAELGCPTTCTTTCTSFSTGEGAAIADNGLLGVTVSSSTFTDNVGGGASPGSTGKGGALALAGGTPVITGSTFTGNEAGGATSNCGTGQGGAIVATVPLVVNDDTFTGNTAGGDGDSAGGAIYNTAATVTGTNDTFTQNAAVGAGSSCVTDGTAVGGAVAALGVATFSNSTFSQNSATANSAAFAGAVGGDGLMLTNDTFTSNAATATGAFGASTQGGSGAVFSPDNATITGSTFSGNTSTIGGATPGTNYGGAVMVEMGLVSSGNTYTSNEVLVAAGAGAGAKCYGGAVADYDGTTAYVTGDTYKDNTASSPSGAAVGGLYIVLTTSPMFVVSNSTFTGNVATSATLADAGALGVNAPGEVLGSTFTSNAATSSASGTAEAGAYYDNGDVVLQSDTFTQNSAQTSAGGLYTGADIIDSSVVTGNTVTSASGAHNVGGGGIYATGAIAINGSTISNNAVTFAATAPGGGGGGIFNESGLTLQTSTVSGNSVLGTSPILVGGGIVNLADTAIENSTIALNKAATSGGGIYNASSDRYTFTNDTIYQNSATVSGGNIYNPYAMTLTNTIVAGGSAASGADILNTGGTITSGKYNIIQTTVVGGTYAPDPTDKIGVTPQLLALADNGGPTFTNADTATSPGTGYIPYSGGVCGTATVATDQRGYTRGAGGVCDVGAFEYAGVAAAIRIPHRHVVRKANANTHGLIGDHGKLRFAPLQPLP